MAIQDNYVPVKTSGDGVTANFSGNWNIIALGFQRVYWEDKTTGVQTLKTYGSHYTMVFDASGFTVTFTGGNIPPSTVWVVIGREISLTQEAPYKTSTGFDGKVIENSFDKITAITQDLQDQINRAPKLTLGSTIVLTIDEEPEDGKALIGNAAGTGYINSDANFDDVIAEAEAFRDEAEGFADAAEADATQTALDRVQTGLDVIAAAASATTASNYVSSLTGTSTTSLAISVASKVFTTQAGKTLGIGRIGGFVIAASAADPANYMHGQVTAYDNGTGDLTVNVTNIGGTGTLADWIITVSGTRGATGATGPTGPAGTVSDGDKGDIAVTGSGATWTADPTLIQGKSTVAPAVGDYMLLSDADGSNALIKATVADILALGGGGDIEVLTRKIVSNASDVQFINGVDGDMSDPDALYAIIGRKVRGASSGEFRFQVSTDTGATWVASTSNIWNYQGGGPGGSANNGNSGTSYCEVTREMSTSSSDTGYVCMVFENIRESANKQVITSGINGSGNSGRYGMRGWATITTTSIVDGIKCFINSANLYGEFTLVKIKMV